MRRLGDVGPLVIARRSEPGRKGTPTHICAVDLSGETTWTVACADLYGDRRRHATVSDVVDDHVVTGVNVESGLSAAIAVASIDASGSPTPAPRAARR